MTWFVPVTKIEGKFKNCIGFLKVGNVMDILDPLETGSETEIVESKVIVKDLGDYSTARVVSMESDDEQNIDHLSPQTLLETPGDDVHYSLRSPDGIVTYGVLKVDEAVDPVPQIVTTAGSNSFPNTGVQVLTSNLNGQLYVISNPNEVFTQSTGTRTIAPRSNMIDQNTTILPGNRKRDERRRATHNEVERRRRDKINNWITKLSKIIPDSSSTDIKGNGHFDGQSKGGILAKACQYITELQKTEKDFEEQVKENKVLLQTVEILKQKNAILEHENRAIKEMLKRSGIDIPDFKCPVHME